LHSAPRKTTSRLRDAHHGLTASAILTVGAFALAPFLGFISDNRHELVGGRRVLLYGTVMVVVAVAALFVALAVSRGRDADRLGACIAIVLVAFFNYYRLFDTTSPIPKPALQLALWLVLTSALVVLMWNLSQYRLVTQFALLLGVFLCIGAAVTYLLDRPESVEPNSAAATPTGDATAVQPSNVYFFVLDAYGRADQLDSIFGHDNTDFLAQLRDDGFTIGEESYSSYMKTLLAVPAIMEMDYPADDESGLPGGILQLQEEYRGDNATVERLKSMGYTYIFSSPGIFDWSRCDERADRCIEPSGQGIELDEVDRSLIRVTPIGALIPAREPLTDPLYVLDELDELDPPVEEPFFLFAHILSPHGPQRYEADCGLRDSLMNPSDPPTPSDLEAFRMDLVCLNEQILSAVDRILERDPDAIIVLLGDHGSDTTTDYGKPLLEWSDDGLREMLAPLDAIRLPAGCETPRKGSRSIVNTFRIVFGCIEDRPVEYLDGRAFVWTPDSTIIEEISRPEELLAPAPG
jgi:hypothetical protein